MKPEDKKSEQVVATTGINADEIKSFLSRKIEALANGSTKHARSISEINKKVRKALSEVKGGK